LFERRDALAHILHELGNFPAAAEQQQYDGEKQQQVPNAKRAHRGSPWAPGGANSGGLWQKGPAAATPHMPMIRGRTRLDQGDNSISWVERLPNQAVIAGRPQTVGENSPRIRPGPNIAQKNGRKRREHEKPRSKNSR